MLEPYHCFISLCCSVILYGMETPCFVRGRVGCFCTLAIIANNTTVNLCVHYDHVDVFPFPVSR